MQHHHHNYPRHNNMKKEKKIRFSSRDKADHDDFFIVYALQKDLLLLLFPSRKVNKARKNNLKTEHKKP